VFESADGSVEEVAQIQADNAALDVAGDYATWTDYAGNPGDLTRHDMRNHTSVLLSSAADLSDVSADGDVVYGVVENVGPIAYTGIFRYEEGGLTTRLTDDADQSNISPVTDGATVLYLKTPPESDEYSLAMNDGVTEEVIASGTDRTDNDFSYALENGWIAYTDDGPSGQFQVWVRAPDGTTTQVSAFNEDSAPQALGSDGEIAFTSGGRRYVSFPPYDSVEEISSDLTAGPIVWQDGTLLVVLRKTLLQFVP
jgi:hypothetical protein